ncbi:MAG: proline dehydrogenase family protein [Acidobacteria bacterium]|jgi:proline dehydrogenase|nr:proline dehydrogenase family protein [Acidobacteriota bacterium]
MNEFKLDFYDTKTAFADKSNEELRKKYWLFKLLNSTLITNLGTKLTELAFRMKLPVKGLVKETVFRQFCGGETIEECEATIQKLGGSQIGTILDYSIEGKASESVFERTKNEIYRTVTRAKEELNIPFAVFKTTGVARFEILEKISAQKELLKGEAAEWERAKARIYEICSHAYSLEQSVFVDAEETWIQEAIDNLVVEMMQEFNLEKPIIFNTIQLYRHDRLEFLKELHQKAKSEGYILAVKLVRGAYMEKERARADEMNYPSPIHKDKQAVDLDFDLAVEYCLENIEEIAFVVGTHNEQSVQKLAQLMEQKNIPHNHPHIFFSQLYGMGDNLSYVLADNNFNVSKYVPYGPVKDTVPYLIRRARENTSVTGQMSRELDLLSKELERRRVIKH